MNATPRWARLLTALLAVLLLAFAIFEALLEADSVTVAAFLAAGVLLLLIALAPALPTKFSFGGGSVEWTAEQLVDRVYEAELDAELIRRSRLPVEPAPEPIEAGGAPWPQLEDARELARRATTPAELQNALHQAINVARQKAAMTQQHGPPRSAER